MRKYNPDLPPDPEAWLALDESEQTELVTTAHADAGLDMTQLLMHATGHVAVETQLAMKLPHVVDNFKRLRKEGLGRHDAIHACAAIVMEMIYNISKGEEMEESGDEYYKRRLGEMTAGKWWNQNY